MNLLVILSSIFKIINFVKHICRCGGMADAFDSKSNGKPCGFESHHRHQKTHIQMNMGFLCYYSIYFLGFSKAGAVGFGSSKYLPGVDKSKYSLESSVIPKSLFDPVSLILLKASLNNAL